MIRKYFKSFMHSARFGPYRFEKHSLRLFRRGKTVALGGQPLEILQVLLDQPGKIVTRRELEAKLWPDLVGVDTTRRLNTAIRALRRALGDHHDHPLYIETVRHRGYRWIGYRATARFRGVTMAMLSSAVGLMVVGLAFSLVNQGALARSEHESQLRAEAAVRMWRLEPTASNYSDASASVARVTAEYGESAAMVALAGELALYGGWDWSKAERKLKNALQLDPGHRRARMNLAWLYTFSGEEASAWEQVDQLVTSSHETDTNRAELGWMLLKLSRPDLSLLLCDADSEFRGHFNLLACRHTALARTGQVEAARRVALAVLGHQSGNAEIIAEVANASPEAGYQRFLEWQAEAPLVGENDWFLRAQLQAQAGDMHAAKISLRKALAARDPLLIRLRATPELNGLSDWQGYTEILAASGILRETGS